MNGTPILDIKPYIPYTDVHTDAKGSFSDEYKDYSLSLGEGLELLDVMPEHKASVLKKLLVLDPRPAYHNEPDRVYAFEYGGYHIEFRVEDGVLFILQVDNCGK
jgi:hypothetical protein